AIAFEPDLPSPTALEFSGLSGNQVEFYAATEGRESAILVALSLGGQSALPPPFTDPPPSPVETGVAHLVAIDDSSLALVGSLLIVTIETPTEESTAPTEISAETSFPPDGLGQSDSSHSLGNSEETTEDTAGGEDQATEITPARGRMTWERF